MQSKEERSDSTQREQSLLVQLTELAFYFNYNYIYAHFRSYSLVLRRSLLVRLRLYPSLVIGQVVVGEL